MGVIRQQPSEIIESFLNRQLDNFDWIKDVSEEDLDKQILDLAPCPLFTLPLKKPQKAMFLLGITKPNFLFLADLGMGKTALSLNIINYLKQTGKINRALVLVTNVVLIQSWLDECNKFTPNLKAVGVYGKKKDRLNQLDTNADAYILNYAGLQVLLADFIAVNKKHKKRSIDSDAVKEFANEFDCLILDEITAVKNIQSTTYKICNKLANVIPYRYGLTGRPFGRHQEDLWAQFHIVDRGQTLGTNFYFFRSCYFNASKKPWGIDWTFKKRLTNNLHDKLKNRSIRYKLEDASLIPTRIIYRALFPKETIAYFDVENQTLKKNVIDGNIEQIKASFIKLREIASGFVVFKDETGEKQKLVFPDNPKLDLLLEKVKEIPNDCKAIIFHEFTFSGEQISKALKKAGINYRWIYGKTPDKFKVQYLQEFKTNPEVTVLVLNAKSGALGLNLQHANFLFFYESPVSPMVRAQAEGRIIRPGQLKATFIIDLVIKDSKDEDILDFIKEGKNLLESLIENRGE